MPTQCLHDTCCLPNYRECVAIPWIVVFQHTRCHVADNTERLDMVALALRDKPHGDCLVRSSQRALKVTHTHTHTHINPPASPTKHDTWQLFPYTRRRRRKRSKKREQQKYDLNKQNQRLVYVWCTRGECVAFSRARAVLSAVARWIFRV